MDEDSYPYCNSLPIMLALCPMLFGTCIVYYAKKFAGIICLGLAMLESHPLCLKISNEQVG